jgi:hypothetical protein
MTKKELWELAANPNASVLTLLSRSNGSISFLFEKGLVDSRLASQSLKSLSVSASIVRAF